MEEKDGRATLVVTYNSVRNFPAGTYRGKNGPVIVVSDNNIRTWGKDEAESRFAKVLQSLYGRTNLSDVEEIFLYSGLYAMEGTLYAAISLAGENNHLTLVACDCNEEIKLQAANIIGVPIIWSDCGGRRTLESIVRNKLGNNWQRVD